MTLTTLIFALTVTSLAALGIFWPWFEDTKNEPWQD